MSKSTSPTCILSPLNQLDATKLASVNGFAKEQPLDIFCRTGNRAKQAAEKLEKGGYTQCHVVEGGTMAWADAGLPVNRGTSKVISLERQVRIAAGGIVLLFAGITDLCGMGMLIAKLPWNQRGVASCGAAKANI